MLNHRPDDGMRAVLMWSVGKTLNCFLLLASATHICVRSGDAIAASFHYSGGGLTASSLNQDSSGTAQTFAPSEDLTWGSAQLRTLHQTYLGYSPIVAELLLDGGAYGKEGGFYDTAGKLSWDYNGPASIWHLALESRFGDDERGLLRRSLKEQFDGRFYRNRGKRTYQFMSAELFQRGEIGRDWFTKSYLLGQYLYRDLSTRDVLLQLNVGHMITPVWAIGVGAKGFAQWWQRSFSDSMGAFIFTEYEYFPEAKMRVLLGSGEARAQGTKQPSQLYEISFEQPLVRGSIETSYEKSQSAAAAGNGVNVEETGKLLCKYELTQAQLMILTGKSVREKQFIGDVTEKRQREQLGLAYAYRWGRGLKIGKDEYENQMAISFDTERWRQRGAGAIARDSISASWSFLK